MIGCGNDAHRGHEMHRADPDAKEFHLPSAVQMDVRTEAVFAPSVQEVDG